MLLGIGGEEFEPKEYRINQNYFDTFFMLIFTLDYFW